MTLDPNFSSDVKKFAASDAVPTDRANKVFRSFAGSGGAWRARSTALVQERCDLAGS